MLGNVSSNEEEEEEEVTVEEEEIPDHKTQKNIGEEEIDDWDNYDDPETGQNGDSIYPGGRYSFPVMDNNNNSSDHLHFLQQFEPSPWQTYMYNGEEAYNPKWFDMFDERKTKVRKPMITL